MDEISSFLRRFHESSNVDDTFTCGCCYWFAFVLQKRFSALCPVIVYDCIRNHFGTKINGRVYDITGDITDTGEWIVWDEYDDDLHKERIVRDCIMF